MPWLQSLRRAKSLGAESSQRSEDGRQQRTGLLGRLRRSHTDTSAPRRSQSTGGSSKGGSFPELHGRSHSEASVPVPEHGTPGSQVYPEQNSAFLNEVKKVFSGAPHFMLERGQDGKLYPQVIFPWDQDQGIQDLWDRQPLRHSSFTLSTMHAHLPVPDDWSGGRPRMDVGKTDKIGGRRATFDVGVFEVPNMLGRSTKEPGCIGYRNYMELPISDSRMERRDHRYLQRPGTKTPRESKLKQHQEASNGEPDPKSNKQRWDANKDAATAWERIGVRNPDVKTISKRLEKLQQLRDEIIADGRPVTILDRESARSLYKDLFSNFLYPPAKLVDYDDPYGIKAQIDILTEALAVDDAWIDFSRVECRVRVGQVLFDNPAYGTGDFVKNLPHILDEAPGVERKWLLLQMVLAAELLLRLDAAVQVGVFRPTKELSVTTKDIHRFNTMRTAKVDWDLIFIRRVFDNLLVQFSPSQLSDEIAEGLDPDNPITHVFELGFTDDKGVMDIMRDGTSWNCLLLPRNPKQQLDGLLVFARILNWPNVNEVEETMRAKLEPSQTQIVTPSRMYGPPVHKFAWGPENWRSKGENEPSDHHNHPFGGLVHLHTPEDPYRQTTSPEVGGWLSRTWLTGIVLPGEPIEHFLISTLLENDTEALKELGPLANLYGGFILGNRSWWSKSSIVGRVLACLDNTSECMGWISSPVIPENVHGTQLGNGWLDVDSQGATTKVFPSKKRTRILDGVRVALESSPLGMDDNDITADSFSLPIENVGTELQSDPITFQRLVLSSGDEGGKTTSGGVRSRTVDEKPAVCYPALTFTFKHPAPAFAPTRKTETITFPLTYNVQFVIAHPCRPPRGHAYYKRGSSLSSRISNVSTHPKEGDHSLTPESAGSTSTLPPKSPTSPSSHGSHSHLPAHPLHASYPYLHIQLSSLSSLLSPTSLSSPSIPAKSLPSLSSKAGRERITPTTKMETVYILETRRSKESELYARAWCATTGNDAVIGRTGRTCLSCCIREARAVGVKVVIRVGG
ncbi:hypothetical protein FQN54_008759 [Arachnomyces sp. PD_36]|nr:hypothetical protein FQN54_008759 [Arachnomyces sp. PD_36]